ncbi:hypothetical protein PC110_g10056, partial [Phytophthora cactorum]
MKATWKIKDVLDANHLPTPQSRQVHVLVEVPEGVSAPENIRKRKRMEDEDAPDAWIKAIKDEQVAALPATCEDLKEHLKRPLHVKVPVNDRLFQIMLSKNTTGELSSILDKLFEPEPRKTLSDITAGVLRDVIDPLGSGSELATEDTYHHLWDSLIAMLLRLVSNGNFRRNTNASTSTGLYRPDLCFYYKNSNICVFRGEEKASGELQVPVKELHEKLTWRYDAAPYVFGYAAVGLQVCLVAIRKDEMTERGAKVEMIETYDLGDLHGRLSFFLALLNFSTLFRPVVDLIQPLDILEYGTIERGNGVQISFAEDCVVKTYPLSMPSDDIIRNLRELHRQMKKHSVPNVVELKKTNMKKKYVKLAPVGRLSPPENVRQLLTALRDILKALVALHAINMMHRDLRWENVLKYPGEGNKWFLIDFDEGASSPAAKKLVAKQYKVSIETLKKHMSADYKADFKYRFYNGKQMGSHLYEGIQPAELYDKLENVLASQKSTFKVNTALGYDLVSLTDDSDTRYFHPNLANTYVFSSLVAINSRADIRKKVISEIRSMELANKLNYPSSGYKLKTITGFKIYIYYRNHALGDSEAVTPKIIRDNKYVINFPRTNNKCVFHCIAWHSSKNSKKDPRKIQAEVKEAFKRYCSFKGIEYSLSLFRGFKPIDLLQFDELEDCFQLSIN